MIISHLSITIKTRTKQGNIKKAHIHVLKRFDKGVTAGFALEWLNRSAGDCITTTGKGAFKDRSADIKDAFKYLAHPNSPLGDYDDGGKYGYDPSAVVTIGKFVPTGYADFMGWCSLRTASWTYAVSVAVTRIYQKCS